MPPLISQVIKQMLSKKVHDNISCYNILSTKRARARTPFLSQSLFAASPVEHRNMRVLSPAALAEL